MSEQADKLREAGYRVVESDEFIKIKPPEAVDDPRASWIEIKRRSDGTLVLFKQRSSTHRQIGAILGC